MSNSACFKVITTEISTKFSTNNFNNMKEEEIKKWLDKNFEPREHPFQKHYTPDDMVFEIQPNYKIHTTDIIGNEVFFYLEILVYIYYTNSESESMSHNGEELTSCGEYEITQGVLNYIKDNNLSLYGTQYLKVKSITRLER